jgi:hypothetical protein
MSRPTTLAILATVGSLSVAPANALAAPITTSQLLSFSLTDTVETAAAADMTLEFDQFDASLGTLTEVVLSIGNPFANYLVVFHSLGGPATVTNAALTWSIEAPLALPLQLQKIICSVCNFEGDLFDFGSSAVGYMYPVASQPNLAIPFIGGGVVPLFMHVQVAGMPQNATVAGTWSGDARLDYTYEPAPATVPEPVSLLLLGTGISAVAWRRTRRA